MGIILHPSILLGFLDSLSLICDLLDKVYLDQLAGQQACVQGSTCLYFPWALITENQIQVLSPPAPRVSRSTTSV